MLLLDVWREAENWLEDTVFWGINYDFKLLFKGENKPGVAWCPYSLHYFVTPKCIRNIFQKDMICFTYRGGEMDCPG